MTELEHARREAIRMLCDAHVRDVVSLEDFDGRLERIRHAPNVATIEAIVADLVAEPLYPVPFEHPGSELTPATGFPEAHRGEPLAEPMPVAPAELVRITSVFASTKRRGSWSVPMAIQALVVLGEMELDLRDAVFVSDAVDIEVNATLGEFKLIVPAGTQVENEIEETLASSTHSTRSARGARPNGLLVRVHGRALLASIEIREKMPTAEARSRGGIWQRLLGRGPAGSA